MSFYGPKAPKIRYPSSRTNRALYKVPGGWAFRDSVIDMVCVLLSLNLPSQEDVMKRKKKKFSDRTSCL